MKTIEKLAIEAGCEVTSYINYAFDGPVYLFHDVEELRKFAALVLEEKGGTL